jgi:mxaJ protein|tara:strand:- start:1764 stop:2651 length:888 start_codon:yes stop_codon:yes gene_type:complete
MLKKLLITSLLVVMSLPGYAADDIPVNADLGKPGEPARVPKDNEFKVCADQDNMPYSNREGEGFENKIAEVLAADLGKDLSYQFWHDRFGFIRNTLKAMRCDVIIGTNTTYDAVNTTKPYYRAGHVWIYRKDSGYDIKDWNSPDLRKAIIGVHDKSPITVALDANNLMINAKPYRIQRNLRESPGKIVHDLANGDTDVVIAWGPIGGYYAKQSKVELVVVPIPEYANENTSLTGKTYWNISVGVRKKEDARRDMIEAALDRNKDKIQKIMSDYGIPVIEPVYEDRLDGYKRHKEK